MKTLLKTLAMRSMLLATLYGCNRATAPQPGNARLQQQHNPFEEMIIQLTPRDTNPRLDQRSTTDYFPLVQRITVDYVNGQVMVSYSANPRQADEIWIMRRDIAQERCNFLDEQNVIQRLSPKSTVFHQVEKDFNERFESWRKSYQR